MFWKRVQGRELLDYMALLLEDGEGRLPSSKLSAAKCVTFLPFEVEEKKIWIEDFLEELELA